MSDHGLQWMERRCGERNGREAGEDGRRLKALESVKKGGEDTQWDSTQ